MIMINGSARIWKQKVVACFNVSQYLPVGTVGSRRTIPHTG